MIRLWLVFAVFAILIHLGITSWRNMTEIIMTKTGVQVLIEQLQVFRDQLADEQEEE